MKQIIYTLSFLLIITVAQDSFAKNKLEPNVDYLRSQLKSLNLNPQFIRFALKNYQSKDFERTLKLNLIGFLKPPEHMDHVTTKAIKETISFTQKHKSSLKIAESKFQVPSEVISSLLWIETKHGRDLGTFHTVSVFMHLTQATEKKTEKYIIQMALTENSKIKKFTPDELKKIINDRVIKKS